jgi:uncharacterized protein
MSLPRRLRLLGLLLCPCALLPAEKVADLPMPTRYVEDFAGVLTPQATQRIEDLCLEVHRQANAELEVVTIKSLDGGQTVEEFSSLLEEKWKIGKKGVDRSALIVLVLNPRKLRVETGYGLEGILPDAKVGRILDAADPYAAAANYDQALLTTVQDLAAAVADDAHVTLTPIVHTYHREAAPRAIGPGQILGGILVILLIVVLIATGNGGWLLYLLLNLLGSGGGGRGGGGGDDSFGGSGGGESGGGGASRDF